MDTKEILQRLARHEISPEEAKKQIQEFLQNKKKTPVLAGSSDLEIQAVYRYLIGIVARTLKFEEKHIDIDDTPANLGIDSIVSVRLVGELEKQLGALPSTLFFEHPTFRDLAQFLFDHHRPQLGFLHQPAPVSAPRAVFVEKPVPSLSSLPTLPAPTLELRQVQDYVIDVTSRVLKFEKKHIHIDDTPGNLGIDSIVSVRLLAEFEKTLGSLPKTLFFEYPTFAEIGQFLFQSYTKPLSELLCAPIENAHPASSQTAVSPALSKPFQLPEPKKQRDLLFATPCMVRAPLQDIIEESGVCILVYPIAYAERVASLGLLEGVQETAVLPDYTTPEDALTGTKQLCHLIQTRMKQKGVATVTFMAVLEDADAWKYGYLHGLFLSVELERPAFRMKVVTLPALAEKIRYEWGAPERRVCYQGQERFYLSHHLVPDDAFPRSSLVQDGGVYWITGGSGGLGRLLAQHLLAQGKQITVILSSRSSKDDREIASWNLPKSVGATWVYKPCDVTDRRSVQEMVEWIEQSYHKLTGILHSAGVLRDSFLINKKLDQIDEVLAPKLLGTTYLDEETQHFQLDYFILFSSEAGAFGNTGQTDYAAANSWMDGFAAYRHMLFEQGKRFGKTLSVNWPLWEEGGMTIPPAMQQQMWEHTGMAPLSTLSGVTSLERMLGMPYTQLMVAEGKKEKIISSHQLIAFVPPKSDELTGSSQSLNAYVPAQENHDIAIIGMSCRFPGGASSPQQYWELLLDHRSVLIDPPLERWDHSLFYDPNSEQPNAIYYRKGAFLQESIRKFDAPFFGISSREADEIDPQHRLLLELSWEAFENAGIVPQTVQEKKMGIFVGVITSEYATLERGQYEMSPYFVTGAMAHMASGRLGYFYNTHGPAISIDTACSSSLVACHLACQSLKTKECDLAMVSGVNLILNPQGLVGLCKLRALSKDGLCKPFDQSADGYGRSDGAGIILLKRLSDAIKEGDHIVGVIKGSAVNHDGRSQGLTVPSETAQIAVMQEALRNAGIRPEDVNLIEAHGTGTPIGDPVEMRALSAVYSQREHKWPLPIGSAKANLGHGEGAAGVASLIKMALCLEHKIIPAHIHCPHPHPEINLDAIPACFPQTNIAWDAHERPRVVATNSFGFSGTNAHLVMQEWNAPVLPISSLFDKISASLMISARTGTALLAYAKKYIAYLSALSDDVPLQRVFYALALHRSHFKHRLVIQGRSKEEWIEALQQRVDAWEQHEQTSAGRSVPAFLVELVDQRFTHQTIQTLCETYPAYVRALHAYWDSFAAILTVSMEQVLKAQQIRSEWQDPLIFCAQLAWVDFLRTLGFPILLISGEGVGAVTQKVIKEGLPLEAVVMQVLSSQFPKANLQQIEGETVVIDCTGAELSSWIESVQQGALQAYQQGIAIDWSALFPGVRCKEIKLPTYPFEPHIHWFSVSEDPLTHAGSIAVQYPLRGETIFSPLRAYQHQFVISKRNLPELSDTHHLVHIGQIYEMCESVFRRGKTAEMSGMVLYDLTCHRALLVDQPLAIHATLVPQENGLERLSFYTWDSMGQEWTLHVSAELQQMERHDTLFTPLVFTEHGKAQTWTRTQFYQHLDKKRVRLGTSVRWVDRVELYPDHLKATLSHPSGVQTFQRGLFDALAQLFHLFLPASENRSKLLVQRWGTSQLLQSQVNGPFYATIVLRDSLTQTGLCGDVMVFDAEGREIFACRNFEMQKLRLKEVELLDHEQTAFLEQIKASLSSEEKKQRLLQFVERSIQKLLKTSSPIDPDESLYTIGFDSIVGLDLRNLLQQHLQIDLDMHRLFLHPTCHVIVDVLMEGVEHRSIAEDQATLWLRGDLTDTTTPRLYCFPYGAGGASEYRDWSQTLSAHYNVIAIQIPGREDRLEEAPFREMEALLDHLERMLPLDQGCSYAFYGHSLGAFIAYLLTLRLQKKQVMLPEALFVGAFSAPVNSENTWLQWIKRQLEEVGIVDWTTSSLSEEQQKAIHTLFMSGSSRELDSVTAEHFSWLLPSFFADLQLVETGMKMSKEQVVVPLIACGGKLDDRVSQKEILDWQSLCSGFFQAHFFEGDHFFLRGEQNQNKLLKLIEEMLCHSL